MFLLLVLLTNNMPPMLALQHHVGSSGSEEVGAAHQSNRVSLQLHPHCLASYLCCPGELFTCSMEMTRLWPIGSFPSPTRLPVRGVSALKVSLLKNPLRGNGSCVSEENNGPWFAEKNSYRLKDVNLMLGYWYLEYLDGLVRFSFTYRSPEQKEGTYHYGS